MAWCLNIAAYSSFVSDFGAARFGFFCRVGALRTGNWRVVGADVTGAAIAAPDVSVAVAGAADGSGVCKDSR